ncbi:hypothetical protein JG687_00018231 [Phytophthora cactorum]|uniref:Peptidase S74 domain-containing protein n=1 Tax=Phytophthora cactorum TaxID=29920 RepID=A0A8T1TL29_9STRA|nr:hypothetical protein JG687_00018231 [Phytophthora cactorum]
MSSGFSYPQPTFQSSIYNPAFYLTLDGSGYLTFDYAQTLYLGKSDYRLSYLTGITQGIATPGIALVPGTGGDISGIGALSCSSLTLSSGGTGLDIPSLKFSGTTFNQNYYINITEGAAGVSQAVVLNSTKDFNGIRNLTCSGTLAAATLTCTGINASSYKQGGTQYDLSHLQYISGASFGSATANNFLLCDSSLNIANISMVSASTISCTNLRQGSTYYDLSSFLTSVPSSLSLSSLYTTGNIDCGGFINGFLAYGNQANITTVGSLTELGIHSTPTNEYFSIKGSSFDYLDGSHTRMLTFSESNITPVQFQIEVHNGTNSTSSNASWIGNITNNDLRFGVNNSTSMILTTTGRLGLGTTSPSAPLHVPGSNNFVFGAGGMTVYRLRTDSGATESALGPITYSVAAIFGGYIACTAMAMTSDRRLKKNIQIAPLKRIKRLYDNCDVKLYDWIESENRPGQEVGLIAQDLVSAHLTDLISVFYRDDIQEGEDPSLEPAKTQLNVDYSRMSAYNMKMIQHLLGEIDRLKDRLANIES